VTIDTALWEPISPSALPQQDVKNLVTDLVAAENPLLVTSSPRGSIVMASP